MHWFAFTTVTAFSNKSSTGLSINLSKSGISTSVKAGPISWNSRVSVNLPGPFSYQSASGKTKELTKVDLVGLAKQAGLTGYSRLKKQELIELLQQHGIL
ncbi:MAG: Rho termination factor N-terminal domain-containing protein [Prochloron sp. SP5CPC1]|nr:Rho termination factor N-terminal domain-containing protein [Candidatus Paraprochloron terpiosi SP5CPC1]